MLQAHKNTISRKFVIGRKARFLTSHLDLFQCNNFQLPISRSSFSCEKTVYSAHHKKQCNMFLQRFCSYTYAKFFQYRNIFTVNFLCYITKIGFFPQSCSICFAAPSTSRRGDAPAAKGVKVPFFQQSELPCKFCANYSDCFFLQSVHLAILSNNLHKRSFLCHVQILTDALKSSQSRPRS